MTGFRMNRYIEVTVETLRQLRHAESGLPVRNSALYEAPGARTFDGRKWVGMQEVATDGGILRSLQHSLEPENMELFFRSAIGSQEESIRFVVHISPLDMKIGIWSGDSPTVSEGFNNTGDLRVLKGDEDGMPSRIRDTVLSLLVMES